jgi:transposase
MVAEHRDEYPSEWAAFTSIAAKLGMTVETLRTWVRRAQVDQGMRPGLTTDERQKLKALEKEVKELRRANEILKDASIFFATELDGRPKKYPLHRFTKESMGSRADLHHLAIRFPDLLRGQATAALCPQGSRRGTQARDQPGPPGEPRRLRRRQGLDPDESRGPP